MTIQHELTPADLKNYLAMRKEKIGTAPDKVRPILLTVYFGAGLLALDCWLDLPLVQFLALIVFCLGFASLFTWTIKRAAGRQVGRSMQGITGLRVYVLAEGVLETQTADSRHLTPLAKIISLESNARGTLLCFRTSSPLFLPFGTEYRPEFIAALREAMARDAGEPPLLSP